MTTQSLSGRVAIVTGAATGIGRDIALAFAREGAAVVATGLTPENKPQDEGSTADLIASSGSNGLWLEADVTDPDQVDRVVNRTVSEFGTVDILANSAGVFPILRSSLEMEPDAWREVIDVNLSGTWHYCRTVIRHMLRQSTHGAIINISSRIAFSGAGAGRAGYCAAKAGVSNLTRQLAVEYGPAGIRVNAICPGFVAGTAAAITRDPARMELARSQTPFHRLGRKADVAAAAVFLASDSSGFINGHNLVVDGGASVRS